MTTALEQALALSRLAHERTSGPTRRFTIARGKALLQLRGRPADPWAFSRELLRAAMLSDEPAVVGIGHSDSDEGEVVAFTFSESVVAGDELAPSELLQAALDPRPRAGSPAVDRWRAAVARAINGALALDPRWIELRLRNAAWRYERTSASDGDPYRVFLRGEPAERGFELHLALSPRKFGSSVRSFFGLEAETSAAIAKEWSAALLWGVEHADLPASGALEAPEALRSFDLGGQGELRVLRPGVGVWLTRGGVAQCRLDVPLSEAQVRLPAYEIAVESERVNLDIDEQRVVQDQEWATLRAWIVDVLVRSPDLLESPFPPPIRATAQSVSGASVHLRALTSHSGDVPYVWNDVAQRAPQGVPANAVGLWPSEVVQLRERADPPRLIPVWLLPRTAGERFDPASLQQGAFEPLECGEVPADDADPRIRRLAVLAHRYPVAEEGRIRIVAWGRTVATFEAEANPIRGVTVLAELDEQDPDAVGLLLADASALGEFAQRLVQRVWCRIEDVLTHVWEHAQFGDWWQVPLLRWMLERIEGATIGLHYALVDQRLRLSWNEHPLLELPIGTDREGTPKTLRHALERTAAVGGIVAGEPDRLWVTLESDEPDLLTWFLSERGRGIIGQVLGGYVIWDMPVAAGAMPRPGDADEQRHLLLSKERVARLLERRGADGRVNDELLAHLLVARILGKDEQGLESVPLLRLYDPNGASPRRRVSFARARELSIGRIAPVGTRGVGQRRPFVEATPGFAELMRAAWTWNPSPPPPPPPLAVSRSRAPRTVKRHESRATSTTIWVREPVVHRLCAGAVHLGDEDEPAIELWGRGARLGAFRLPRPLRQVGGRLWLTDEGVEAGRAKVVRIAIGAAQRLQLQSRVVAQLCEPGSERAKMLAAFAGDALVAPSPAPAPNRRFVLHQNDSERLVALVRYALDRPVKVETPWLSWTAASVEDAGYPGSIEIGKRHTLVKAALEPDASARDVLLGAATIVGHVVREAPEAFEALGALDRILATAGYAPAS